MELVSPPGHDPSLRAAFKRRWPSTTSPSLRAKTGATLEISAKRRRGGLLHAPEPTQMHRRVEETLDARIHLRLADRAGQILLEDCGEVAALEVHGDIDGLLAMT